MSMSVSIYRTVPLMHTRSVWCLSKNAVAVNCAEEMESEGFPEVRSCQKTSGKTNASDGGQGQRLLVCSSTQNLKICS